MIFTFPSLIQAGLASGKYEIVRNAAGILLPIVRDTATGQFGGHATAIVNSVGVLMNPISIVLQGVQMLLTHKGFKATDKRFDTVEEKLDVQMDETRQLSQAVQFGLQSIQANLGVLQTMSALTGIGVVANIGISAVSLWQILKLREDVKQQRIEMREGFLDLKQVMKDQKTEITQQINEAVQSIEFNQQRQVLAQAYGRFLEATRLIQIAMSCDDLSIRNADLANARQTLNESLADYKNPHFVKENNAITRLRRAECVWTIEQTIAVTYQLQDQLQALSGCLEQLQDRIRQDVLAVVDLCESEEELDIIFPEILRIHDQDLVVLQTWQAQVDWMRSLPPFEQQLLQSANASQPEIVETPATVDIAIPSEQLIYETWREKSHFAALCGVLQLMMNAEIRRDYEIYISQQAEQLEHKALVASNLQQMSDLAIANLYCYFLIRDESEPEPAEM